jgi:thymidine phosphorylase
VTADEAGFVTRMEALPFGIAAWRLGAGRARAEDPVMHAAGIDLHVKPGDEVSAGQPLFTLLGHDATRFERALGALEGAWEIGSDAPASRPLVLERITA